MSKIYRNDIFVRGERGGEWFEEFLRSFAENPPPTTQSILDAINQKRGETVESVVSKYREAVGLDLFAEEEPKEQLVATASAQPISARHAHMLADDKKDDDKGDQKHVILVIEEDPNIKADLESMLENSGGTKNTHAVVNFLRELLGSDLVSYSDDDLMQYIDDMKKKYMLEQPEEPCGQAGKAGIESTESYDDDKADYIEHGKGG